MAECSYCGQETELHQGGMATCINCTTRPVILDPDTFPSIHRRLAQEVAHSATELAAITRTHNEIMGDIPSGLPHPDGVQRIHSISTQVAIVRENMKRAHSRLNDFLESGTIPQDLNT
jgi:hypothetical protein